MIFLGVMAASMGALADSKEHQGALPPSKALLVLTRESWGCLRGQEIKADITALISGDQGPGVRWEEIKNPEDRQDRLELYLYFPAGPVAGVPGYLVLKLGVSGTDPQKPGSVLLKRAELRSGPQGPVFELQGQVRGDLEADLLYAQDFQLSQGFFACPEAGLFEAKSINFLKAFAVKTGLEPIMAGPAAAAGSISIPLRGGFWLSQTRAVAAAAELLDLLNQKFRVSAQSTFLWEQDRVTSQVLEGLASAWEQGKGLKGHIALKLRDRQGTLEIRRAATPFAPQLRQKVTLQDARGRISGGEVWIALDPRR